MEQLCWAVLSHCKFFAQINNYLQKKFSCLLALWQVQCLSWQQGYVSRQVYVCLHWHEALLCPSHHPDKLTNIGGPWCWRNCTCNGCLTVCRLHSAFGKLLHLIHNAMCLSGREWTWGCARIGEIVVADCCVGVLFFLLRRSWCAQNLRSFSSFSL